MGYGKRAFRVILAQYITGSSEEYDLKVINWRLKAGKWSLRVGAEVPTNIIPDVVRRL